MYFQALRCYVFITLGCIISAETDGLRLIDVQIPPHMDLYQAATLTCNFELGAGKLYSVKWYKDENEFFRYMPDNNPQILTFPQNGVSLDLSRSNMTVVTLFPLSFNSSGSYRCEVSTDGPNFETVGKNGNMTVMIFPVDQPTIDGIKEFYAVGDYVIGNCTSSRSNPAAELSWFINNDKAESWLMERYPLVVTEGSLFSSALGLKFQVDEHHFNKDDKLELRCQAKIADLPPWESRTLIRPTYHAYINQRPAPDSYRNIGTKNFSIVMWILLVTLCLTHSTRYLRI